MVVVALPEVREHIGRDAVGKGLLTAVISELPTRPIDDRLASRGWVNSCVKLLRLTLDASTALRGEPSKGCRVDDARLGLAALQQLGQLRKCIVRRSLSDYLNQTWHNHARLNQRVKRSQALCTRIFVSHLATVPTPQSASRWPIAY